MDLGSSCQNINPDVATDLEQNPGNAQCQTFPIIFRNLNYSDVVAILMQTQLDQQII